jgi:hypothetical protein
MLCMPLAKLPSLRAHTHLYPMNVCIAKTGELIERVEIGTEGQVSKEQ